MTSSDIFKNTVFDHPEPFSMLVCSLVAGLILRMLVDVFSVTEKYLGKNMILCFFADFFSVVGAYLFLFVSAYNFNNGIIRWYCIAICIAGYCIFRKFISKPFIKCIVCVADICGKIFSFVTKLLFLPAKKFYRLLIVVYRRMLSLVRSLSRNRAYKREKNKVSASAERGFFLAPHLKEEKEWNRTKIQKRVKRLENRQP